MAKLFTINYQTLPPPLAQKPNLVDSLLMKMKTLVEKCNSKELITSLNHMALNIRLAQAELVSLHQELTKNTLSYRLISLENKIPTLILSISKIAEAKNKLIQDLRAHQKNWPAPMSDQVLGTLLFDLNHYFSETIAKKFLYIIHAAEYLHSDNSNQIAEKLEKVFNQENSLEMLTRERQSLISNFKDIQETELNKAQLIAEIDKLITRVNELIPATRNLNRP